MDDTAKAMENMDVIEKMNDSFDISSPPKTKKKKSKSKKKDSSPPMDTFSVNGDLYKSISNPDKMLASPLSSIAATKRQDGVQGKDKKKKKKKKNKYASSFSSVSSSSSIDIDGSSMGSISFGGSSASSSSSRYSKSDDDSRFQERQDFTMRKRHEEIMQEKFVMLTRISKMSKGGITARKKFSMKDDIDDIRFECYRMTREKNSQTAVKSMHMVLITIATIVEKANSAFNPFNLNLSGFSQNMMLTVSDYDDSLEEIHHKWSGKTYMGPEVSVLMTFMTSAIFYHVGNGGNSDQSSKKSSSSSPMMSLFSSMLGGSGQKKKETPVYKKPEPEVVPDQKPSASTVPPKKRKTMKGPSGPSPFAGLVPNVVLPS